MKRKIIVNNKEFAMPKMSIDTYTEYLELAEVIDTKQRKGSFSASGSSTFVRFTLVSAFCRIEILPIAIPENTDLPSNTLITPSLLD